MRESDLERVKAQFPGVSDETFQAVTAGGFLQRFPAGTTLLTEGDNVDFLYVLLEGAVELTGGWRDKETILEILRPVSTFILAAVVLEGEAQMGAQTIERSDILMLPGEALRRSMQEDAQFAFLIARELSSRYRSMVRALKNQKLRAGAERLASYLIALQAQLGGPLTFHLPYEKRVLASLLGMTPENLSRAVSTLADYGVEIRGRQVALTRPVVLARLAKPDPLLDDLEPAGATAASTDAARTSVRPAR